jgi:hypothetical protein
MTVPFGADKPHRAAGLDIATFSHHVDPLITHSHGTRGPKIGDGDAILADQVVPRNR